MKKITLSAIIIMTSIISLQAQLYTPPGTVLGNSLNSNIGIGTDTPLEKLSISGHHTDTRFLLYSRGSLLPNGEASLMLWASEPGLTYTGAGIGNNIHNYKTNAGNLNLLNPARGGSYIRLLDNAMSFNVVSASGTDKQALNIDSNGSIGIGTVNTIAKLTIRSTSADSNGAFKLLGFTYPSDQSYWSENQIAMMYNGEFKTLLSSIGNSYLNGGNVGIGTSNPDEKLTVNGKIHAQEVRIDLSSPMTVPDYVFANDYKLKSLQEVEEFIKQNSHLPEIPSAKEIEKNGLMLAEMNMSLLKKVEELTLYSIAQEKKINTQAQEIEASKTKIEKLEIENQAFRTLSERLSRLENQLK